LNRPVLNNIENETWISRTYHEAMRQPNLWWEPMATEIAILKARDVYKVVPRPIGRNVIGSK